MRLLREGNPDSNALTRMGRVSYLHIASQTEIPDNLRNGIWFSCMTEQIHFMTDGTGDVIGYLCWARLCRESLTILKREAVLPAYVYEWDDGPHLCLFYCFILPHYRSRCALMLTMPKNMFRGERHLYIFREKQLRRYKRP